MNDRRGRRPEDADYGLGEHTIDLDDVGLLSEDELTRRIVTTFESRAYEPPRLPSVATRLLALSRRADVEFREIEAVLEQDAVLAGEVLSLARSAFYARTRRVESLRDALVLLGLKKLSEVVMQAAMNLRVFRSPAYASSMDRLRDHSRVTAHVARVLSLYTPISEEQAFLCGLLHDVGIAGVLLVLGEGGRGGAAPDLDPLWPAIDAAHAKAGARMIALWGLPPDLSLAVGAHHHVRIDGFDHPLAATLCLAEEIARDLGLGFDAGPLCRVDRTPGPVVARATDALGLDETVLDLARGAAREWADAELSSPAAR